jgi:hypothetical protein
MDVVECFVRVVGEFQQIQVFGGDHSRFEHGVELGT